MSSETRTYVVPSTFCSDIQLLLEEVCNGIRTYLEPLAEKGTLRGHYFTLMAKEDKEDNHKYEVILEKAKQEFEEQNGAIKASPQTFYAQRERHLLSIEQTLMESWGQERFRKIYFGKNFRLKDTYDQFLPRWPFRFLNDPQISKLKALDFQKQRELYDQLLCLRDTQVFKWILCWEEEDKNSFFDPKKYIGELFITTMYEELRKEMEKEFKDKKIPLEEGSPLNKAPITIKRGKTKEEKQGIKKSIVALNNPDFTLTMHFLEVEKVRSHFVEHFFPEFKKGSSIAKRPDSIIETLNKLKEKIDYHVKIEPAKEETEIKGELPRTQSGPTRPTLNLQPITEKPAAATKPRALSIEKRPDRIIKMYSVPDLVSEGAKKESDKKVLTNQIFVKPEIKPLLTPKSLDELQEIYFITLELERYLSNIYILMSKHKKDLEDQNQKRIFASEHSQILESLEKTEQLNTIKQEADHKLFQIDAELNLIKEGLKLRKIIRLALKVVTSIQKKFKTLRDFGEVFQNSSYNFNPSPRDL